MPPTESDPAGYRPNIFRTDTFRELSGYYKKLLMDHAHHVEWMRFSNIHPLGACKISYVDVYCSTCQKPIATLPLDGIAVILETGHG